MYTFDYDKLEKELKKRNMSCIDVAIELGINMLTLSSQIKDRWITFDNAVSICKYLKIDINKMIIKK